ncbi:hypothetical protein GBAR_LOCUS15702 [Geodia barretti]|uniref:Uncharacterized protein n=1 Tax=Geodia barretti TaxID=519541 RepID=A0AA35WUT1_GEOBA|nr:hypothetical protein GBAR_LOCUS15702 [Geodia barretti]
MSFLCCVETGGSLVSCSTTDGGWNLVLRHRLCEREGAWSFQTTTCPSAGRTVALHTTLDNSRGITVPFLVSRRASSDVLEVHSLCPSPSDTLVSHGTLNTDSGGLEKNLTVLDGPTLVWGQQEKVCVALPDVDTGVRGFTKRDIVLGGFIGRSGLTVERLWAFHCHHDLLLLLVRCSSSSDCEAEPVTQWCCLSVDVAGRGGKRGELDVRLVPSHRCVPADYGCVAVCVAVCQFWGVGGEGGMWSETRVLIGTSYRQLVVLRGGIPVHCVAMEATPMHLQVLLVSGDEVVVAVKSVDRRVKAYSVSSCGEREVREEGRWEGVSQTAVGDFASLNRQQLLLLLAPDGTIHMKSHTGKKQNRTEI